MASLEEKLVEAWLKRISDKMLAECSSSVEFVVGKDIKVTEVDWIKTKLSAALRSNNIGCSEAYFNSPGKQTYCDCNSSVCYHSDGLKVIFYLCPGAQ